MQDKTDVAIYKQQHGVKAAATHFNISETTVRRYCAALATNQHAANDVDQLQTEVAPPMPNLQSATPLPSTVAIPDAELAPATNDDNAEEETYSYRLARRNKRTNAISKLNFARALVCREEFMSRIINGDPKVQKDVCNKLFETQQHWFTNKPFTIESLHGAYRQAKRELIADNADKDLAVAINKMLYEKNI